LNRKPIHPVLVALTGLVGVLGIARFCDAVMQFLQYLNAQTFSLNYVIFGVYALVTLLLAAAWLLVAWVVLMRLPGNAWVSLVYLLVGLFMLAYPLLYYTPALCCGLPNLDQIHLEPNTYLYSSGGFAAIIGLVGLVWSRKAKTGAAQRY
jgi:hypothetical protein